MSLCVKIDSIEEGLLVQAGCGKAKFMPFVDGTLKPNCNALQTIMLTILSEFPGTVEIINGKKWLRGANGFYQPSFVRVRQ